MHFTEHQKIALEYNTRLAIECAHPRFQWFRGRTSVILTVDSGYE
jgi:hypothetical protein